jgi:hypothetical protein
MIKINFTNKMKEIITNIIRQKINTKLVMTLILVILTGCIHKKESCFEAFGGSIIWNRYLTIKFDNKFKQIIPSSCINNENFSLFSVNIGILDERIKREDGNTAIMQFSIIPFVKKLDSNQINNAVNYFSRNSFLEVDSINDKNNSRFLRVYSKIGLLTNDKYKVCRIVTTSVKDQKAKNIPLVEKYLLQNDIHKICFLKNYNQILVSSISYRIKPDLERFFWPHDAIDNLNKISLNILMNDGKPLATFMKIEEKEINNIK